MKRKIWRVAVLACAFAAAVHSQAFAQNAPEPTIDERFQNAREPAPEAELPLLNPQAVNPPSAKPPATRPAPSTGPAYLGVIFSTENRNGAVVRRVNPGSPAEQAGLQPGDTIETLQGQPVNTYQDVLDIVSTMRAGDRLAIEFARRISARTEVALAALPSPSPRSVGYPPDSPGVVPYGNSGAQQELLPVPAGAPIRIRAASPPPGRNPAPQNQNQYGPSERRNNNQDSAPSDGGGRFRGRFLRRG